MQIASGLAIPTYPQWIDNGLGLDGERNENSPAGNTLLILNGLATCPCISLRSYGASLAIPTYPLRIGNKSLPLGSGRNTGASNTCLSLEDCQQSAAQATPWPILLIPCGLMMC